MEATTRSQASAAGEKIRDTTQELGKRAGERVREAGLDEEFFRERYAGAGRLYPPLAHVISNTPQ